LNPALASRLVATRHVLVTIKTVCAEHLSQLPSGKRLHNYGTSPFLMGKSSMEDSSDFTIMMDIWLVVEPYPSEKYEFVSWGYEIPNQMEK